LFVLFFFVYKRCELNKGSPVTCSLSPSLSLSHPDGGPDAADGIVLRLRDAQVDTTVRGPIEVTAPPRPVPAAPSVRASVEFERVPVRVDESLERLPVRQSIDRSRASLQGASPTDAARSRHDPFVHGGATPEPRRSEPPPSTAPSSTRGGSGGDVSGVRKPKRTGHGIVVVVFFPRLPSSNFKF
jgi:hypothetical protein